VRHGLVWIVGRLLRCGKHNPEKCIALREENRHAPPATMSTPLLHKACFCRIFHRIVVSPCAACPYVNSDRFFCTLMPVFAKTIVYNPHSLAGARARDLASRWRAGCNPFRSRTSPLGSLPADAHISLQVSAGQIDKAKQPHDLRLLHPTTFTTCERLSHRLQDRPLTPHLSQHNEPSQARYVRDSRRLLGV